MAQWLFKPLRWLFQNKGKFLLMILSTMVFIFVLFPFGDLSDLVSTQVAKLTQNQVYLQFDKMHMNLLPTPNMGLETVHVETQGLPAIRADELLLSPSLQMLITRKPAGSVSARGFLRGDLEMSLKPGTKSDNGVERQQITVNAKHLNLSELRDLLQLPVALRGQLDVTSSALADLSWQEQPDMDLNLQVDHFELPTANVQTMMGPLTLPDLKLTSVEIKGRLSAGKLIIENGVIGKTGDEVYGSIKGNLGVILQRQGSGVAPQTGAYSFDVDLTVQKSFQDRAHLFLSFVDNYKTETPNGAHYKFKVSAGGPLTPPNVSALR